MKKKPTRQSKKLPDGNRKHQTFYILAGMGKLLAPVAKAQNRSVNNLVETALLELYQRFHDRGGK